MTQLALCLRKIFLLEAEPRAGGKWGDGCRGDDGPGGQGQREERPQHLQFAVHAQDGAIGHVSLFRT